MLEGLGCGGLKGTDKSVKVHKTDNTAGYRRKQGTRQALIDNTCVHVHLQKKSNKIWVVYWAPEALKLMNFLSEICLQ